VAALNAIHAGSSVWTRLAIHLAQLGTDTGTVDAAGNPFVYAQSSGDFGTLVVDAVLAVAQGVPMDIAARGVDDRPTRWTPWPSSIASCRPRPRPTPAPSA